MLVARCCIFFCHACNCGFSSVTVFWFWVFCCEISNYFFCDYNQECYCQLDMFLVSKTIIVRPFQHNQDCYCGYFIPIVFNQVRYRLRLECPGSIMRLYGPTFHVTAVGLCKVYLYTLGLCIIFQRNLYISCIMSCGNKIISNCFIFNSVLFTCIFHMQFNIFYFLRGKDQIYEGIGMQHILLEFCLYYYLSEVQLQSGIQWQLLLPPGHQWFP